MILTQCAVCATKLGLSLETDRGRLRLRTWHRWEVCGSCSTRYCSAECRELHWEKGGHDQLCKHIERAGGAEQFYANTKYTEAVAVAAEACADDTKGQTCYICYGEGDEDEGLVRGCSCRGGAGFAHVSCLARQAKILVEDAEARELDDSKFERWSTCGLCEQQYHGVVLCALGWACWKTYVGRPEGDWAQRYAMVQLGIGLLGAKHHEDALSVLEADLSRQRRLGADDDYLLVAQGNLACTYEKLGRVEEALRLRQEVYSGLLRLDDEHEATLRAAENLASSLNGLQRFEESKVLLRKTMPVARRVLGESNEITLRMRWNYAKALYANPGATLNDLREAVATLEETERVARRVLGGTNPLTEGIEEELRDARNARKTALADALADMRVAGFGILMCHEKLNLQAR